MERSGIREIQCRIPGHKFKSLAKAQRAPRTRIRRNKNYAFQPLSNPVSFATFAPWREYFLLYRRCPGQVQTKEERMKPIVRNILGILAGLLVGSAVNMGLIMVSGMVIPPPPGVDVTTMEGMKASMHLFEPKHFVFPFLEFKGGWTGPAQPSEI
jgi:hypothetical protein